jgi:NAD(P)-dependent dehydrogenase (short-subunit alcohol dehydrogenase family)
LIVHSNGEVPAFEDEQGKVAVITGAPDPTIAENVAALGSRVADGFGGRDIVVHSAGIYPLVPFLEMTFDQWRSVLSLNLDSLFHLGQAFVPGMIEQKWGRVVSMASTTFHTGFGGFTHYNASKGGLIGFTRTPAEEVGDF